MSVNVTKKQMKSYMSQREIDSCLVYIDYHLLLLSEALRKGDAQTADFQKSQLQKIWNRLNELEHFPYKAF